MGRYLKQQDMTFETYVLGVATGSVWADKYIIGAIEHMFNISISIVSPAYKSPWKIFHNSEIADIVIVSNGYSFGHKKQPTHFSSTEKVSKNWKKIGHDVKDNTIKSVTGVTAGKKAASKIFILEESEQILKKHYLVSKKLNVLVKQVKNCEEELLKIEDELCEMDYDKDIFHRFHSYMDNLDKAEQVNIRKFITGHKASVNTVESDLDESNSTVTIRGTNVIVEKPNSRKIPKITYAEIMGKEIMKEKQKAKTTISTKTVRDVSETVVNPGANIHADSTNNTDATLSSGTALNLIDTDMSMVPNVDIDSQESSQQIVSNISKPDVPPGSMDANIHVDLLTVDEPLDENEPDVILESNADMSTHGDQPQCTENVHSTEETSDVREPIMSGTVNQSKNLDTTSCATTGAHNVNSLKNADTVLSEKTASDLNKSDRTLAGTDANEATSNNKRKAIEINDVVSPKARRQELEQAGTPERFHCQNCSANYKNRKDLLRHQREVCGKKIGSYLCAMCEENFFPQRSTSRSPGKSTYWGKKA